MAVEQEIFFMIGCPRSGSTFLNHVLRDYLDLGFANELQLIPKYYKKLKAYGDLTKHTNLRRLIGDVHQEPYFSLFERVYSEKMGKHVRITEEDIYENLPESSFSGVIYAVLKTTADQLGKKRIGNKHLIMGLHPDWLDTLFPKSKIIHLIRDGRDCTLSLMRIRWGHANVYAAGSFWAQNILRPRNYKSFRSSDRYMEVRYEDFLDNPVIEMDRLRRFVGENFRGEDSETMFGDLRNRVKKSRAYKWKHQMKPKELAIFQAAAGDALSDCGYEPYPKKLEIGTLWKYYYLAENRILREYKYRFQKRQ